MTATLQSATEATTTIDKFVNDTVELSEILGNLPDQITQLLRDFSSAKASYTEVIANISNCNTLPACKILNVSHISACEK